MEDLETAYQIKKSMLGFWTNIKIPQKLLIPILKF